MTGDTIPGETLAAWGCWAEVVVPGSAVRYVWAGGPVVSVVIGGRHRAGLDASQVDTLGGFVRLAVADWRTWGGRINRLPRSTPAYRLRLAWPQLEGDLEPAR